MSEKQRKLSLSRLINNNKAILIFSIIIAVIFWLTIKIGPNTTTVRTITDITVNITTEDTAVGALGLDVISGGTNQKVNVRVQGPSYVVNALTSSDILVTASMSDVTAAGTYRLPLVASKNSTTLTDYTILGVTPSELEVTFDNISTKSFTPVAYAEGAKATEGLIAESAIITDTAYSTLEISGPATELQRISTVQAYAAVNKTLSASESFDAVIRLLDEDGNEIDQTPFTLGYQTLKITVPIYKSRQLGIVPTFTNLPPDYVASAVPYTLSATTVNVIGPPEVIDNLTQIELTPIDFDNVSPASLSFTCQLSLPNAVKDVENLGSVEVTLGLDNLTTARFTVSTVNCINLDSPNLTATVTQNIRNVELCGDAAVIAAIQEGNIYAEVDLSGKASGEYNVLANIKVNGVGNVWQVGTYSVLVTIS